MDPVLVKEGIYWVGAIDWDIRDFHGYAIHYGTTYNAFLIMDEKITLIDTVKKEKADEMLARVSKIVDPKKIDYVVSNHTEMDHSGGLPRIMHRIGENKPLYCSKIGQKNLSAHFREKWNYQPVDNSGTLSLGKRSLVFLETRMLHWPDSMFSYCPEEKLLFSSDAFGQHYAGLPRFDDQMNEDIMSHAKKYFANILMPYSGLVLKLLDKVKELGLAIETICPDHGILWRANPGRILDAYLEWGTQKPTRKAVVVFDTMWHSTEKMAETIVEALGQAKVDAKLMRLRAFHRSDIVAEILDAGAVIIGSPTLNNGLYPTIADFLCYLKGLKPSNKIGAAFGSYGWSGEAVKLLTQEMEAMKFKIVGPGARGLFVPDDQLLASCSELARKVAAELPE
ncbi:MAG: FprA family A-type flavoprotein [Deltaproteobacteria bacterium]|nr:FprA family A-type flavoprotein [Deltaproteobacteria bacterium]